MEEPDNTEKVIRFGCGALVGAILGCVAALNYVVTTGQTLLAIVVGGTLLCGYLALRFGDRFWKWLPWI